MGPAGLSSVASSVARKLHKAQTGSLYHYTLLILTFAALILSINISNACRNEIPFDLDLVI